MSAQSEYQRRESLADLVAKVRMDLEEKHPTVCDISDYAIALVVETVAPHIEADLRAEVESLRRQLATAKADALREAADALSREKGATFADALTIRWLNDRADMAERSE